VWRGPFFDTVRVEGPTADVKSWHDHAEAAGMNFRPLGRRPSPFLSTRHQRSRPVRNSGRAGAAGHKLPDVVALAKDIEPPIPSALLRKSAYLQHPVFAQYHSETEMLRYIRRLEARDLSLTHSMIPLARAP